MLADFDPLVRDWFAQRFAGATEPQIQGWPEIRAGHDVLISAPTGSGKTLAAFLLCLDRLVRAARRGPLPNQTEVVYVSPLKALSNDIHINLEVPLSEIVRQPSSNSNDHDPRPSPLAGNPGHYLHSRGMQKLRQ